MGVCRICNGVGFRGDTACLSCLGLPFSAPVLADEPALWRSLRERIAGQVQALGVCVSWLFGATGLAVVQSPVPMPATYAPAIESVEHAEIEALYQDPGGEG